MTTARDYETVIANRYTLTPAGEAALAAYLDAKLLARAVEKVGRL